MTEAKVKKTKKSKRKEKSVSETVTCPEDLKTEETKVKKSDSVENNSECVEKVVNETKKMKKKRKSTAAQEETVVPKKKKSEEKEESHEETQNTSSIIDVTSSAKKKSKEKRKKKKKASKDESKDESSETKTKLDRALQYLQLWSNDRTSWSFNKSLQTCLLQHAFDHEKVGLCKACNNMNL